MKIELNKTYLTAGDYVVYLDGESNATPETSPGVSQGGHPITYHSSKSGWYFNKNTGKPNLSNEWNEKLTIIEELPFTLPKLKEGFQWAGGFPQYRVPKGGESFIGMNYNGQILTTYYTNDLQEFITLVKDRRLIVEKIVKSTIEPSVPAKEHSVEQHCRTPKELFDGPAHLDHWKQAKWDSNQEWVRSDGFKIQLNDMSQSIVYQLMVADKKYQFNQEVKPIKPIPFSGPGKYKLANGQVVNLDDSLSCKKTDGIRSNNGIYTTWSWYQQGHIDGLGFKDHSHLYLVEKIEDCPKPIIKDVVVPTNKDQIWSVLNPKVSASALTTNSYGAVSPKFPDEKKRSFVMSSANVLRFATVKAILLTVLAFTGKWTWRGANYWAFEPVKEVATKIMRAVRYATLTAAVAGGIYAYNSPEDAKKFFWDCMPKISVEFESPEILKG